MNHVGDNPALHALPALLDGDVPGTHQGEDVSGQLGEGVLHVDGVAGRRLHVAHPVRPCQLLRFLTGHLQVQKFNVESAQWDVKKKKTEVAQCDAGSPF